MKKSLLRQALRVSLEELPNHPQRRFKHFSFLVLKGRILGFSFNTFREPPIHFGYVREPGHVPKLHSEIGAFLKFRGLIKDESFSLINIRRNRRGELRNSLPCPSCILLLSELGCKEFISITGTDDFPVTLTLRPYSL